MSYGNSIIFFTTFYAVIHRDLKDRMLFLDRQSRFFRSFPGRIRGFRLPIHLEAKSAAVRRLAHDAYRLFVGLATPHLAKTPSRCIFFFRALSFMS